MPDLMVSSSCLSTVLQAAASAFLKAPSKKKEPGSGKSRRSKGKDASKRFNFESGLRLHMQVTKHLRGPMVLSRTAYLIEPAVFKPLPWYLGAGARGPIISMKVMVKWSKFYKFV